MADNADPDGTSIDNEESESNHGQYGRNSLIFLIDSSEPMFKEGENEEECPFTQALMCAHKILSTKIFTADQDSMAVVLLGSKKPNLEDKYGAFSNTFILQDLDKPNKDDIQTLESLIDNKEKIKELKKAAAAPVLADGFWLCSTIFSKMKSKQDAKIVLLFTNNEEPHSVSSDEFKQAERRVSDLIEAGVKIELLPIGQGFKASKFYQSLLLGENEKISHGSLTMDHLLYSTFLKSHKKRSCGKFTFQISPEIKFGVEIHNLIRSATPPNSVKFDKRTSQPVKTITSKFNAETAEELLSSEVRKFEMVAGTKCSFDPEELKTMRALFPVGIILLGFKPISKIKQHLFLSPASFLYFNEDLVKGSRLLFGALLQRCQAREVAPVCYLKKTAATKPRLVALLPASSDDNDFSPAKLNGFHVFYLPFMNDIRGTHEDSKQLCHSEISPNGEEKLVRAGKDETLAAMAIIKKLRGSYDPANFENRSLRIVWKQIEARALNRNTVPEVDDPTEPDLPTITQRISVPASQFKRLIFPPGYNATGIPVNEANVERNAFGNQWNFLTVEMLKGYATLKGILPTGRKMLKADYIELVKNYLNIN